MIEAIGRALGPFGRRGSGLIGLVLSGVLWSAVPTAAVPLSLIWQVSIPGVLLYLTLIGVLWYKMHLLRLSMMKEFREIRDAIPTAFVGEQFLEDHFSQLRTELRELTVRVEHVETLTARGRLRKAPVDPPGGDRPG